MSRLPTVNQRLAASQRAAETGPTIFVDTERDLTPTPRPMRTPVTRPMPRRATTRRMGR